MPKCFDITVRYVIRKIPMCHNIHWCNVLNDQSSRDFIGLSLPLSLSLSLSLSLFVTPSPVSKVCFHVSIILNKQFAPKESESVDFTSMFSMQTCCYIYIDNYTPANCVCGRVYCFHVVCPSVLPTIRMCVRNVLFP